MERKLNLNTVPPTPPDDVQTGVTNTEPVVEPGVGQPVTQSATTEPQATPQTGTPAKAEEQVDTFFEGFNKRYGTQYKSDDEIRSLFGLPKKVTEYETKFKDIEKSVADYKKKIEELEGSQDPLKYFSSPDAYIAEQLKIKYPKSNPQVLHQIATTDLSKMDDLDVLVRDKQLFVPDAPKESVIRSVILKKYGIDPTSDPQEWDEIAVAEMKLDAAAAREKIIGLKSVIEMPKVLTKEQREQAERDALTQKEQAITPLKEQYNKFDKFTHKKIEGFEWDVPSEYKTNLTNMFQSMFIDAGLEPTQENFQTALELRDALLVYEYLPEMREVWLKEGATKERAKLDAELHNTQPPNSTTATDHGDVNTLPGLSKFLSDNKR